MVRGDHLSRQHQDGEGEAKGRPRARTRAFLGWWPKPGAQTETGVMTLLGNERLSQ